MKTKLLMGMVLLLALASPASAQLLSDKTIVGDSCGIALALRKSQEYIGERTAALKGALPDLVGVTEAQRSFLPIVPRCVTVMKPMLGKGFEVFASDNEAFINAELKKAGSRLKIKFNGSDGEFAAVVILKVEVEWAKPGDVAVINGKTKELKPFIIKGAKAFRMLKDKHDIRVLRTEQGPPIIVLTATNGDTLYLQRSDATTDRLELKEAFATALVLRAASAQDASNYTGAIMPFVSIDREVSIDWLTQLKYAGTRYYVSQAKQQVRFKLTEKVAKVETETVVVNETRSSRPSGPVPYVLDDRFFAALVRKGETLPYFSAWIGQEDWVKAEQVAIKK